MLPKPICSCETFRARGEYVFAGNRVKADFPLGAEGAGVVMALGEGVNSVQVRFVLLKQESAWLVTQGSSMSLPVCGEQGSQAQ